MRHLNDAVNKVRLAEHRVLLDMGDDRLKGSKQLWLYGYENIPERWEQRLTELKAQKLKTSQRVARMFQRHRDRILNYFVHRLTNGAAEGINNKIQSLIKKAYGYRNRERFKADIYFHCGALNLYPAFSQ